MLTQARPRTSTHDNTQHFARLDQALSKAWQELFERSAFIRCIQSGAFDSRLYAIYMTETHHYTAHNARNQALAGARAFDRQPQYLKFCFEHADEETGHELLALHDLCSLGLDRATLTLPDPLPATEVLIAYLYWVSETGSTVRRLGYSYWAENCYTYVDPLLQEVRLKLELKDSQLTFFVAHSQIDDAHAKEVQKVMDQHCVSDEDWEGVEQVMLTSLRLTGRMLDEIYEEYRALEEGRPTRYLFLNSIG